MRAPAELGALHGAIVILPRAASSLASGELRVRVTDMRATGAHRDPLFRPNLTGYIGPIDSCHSSDDGNCNGGGGCISSSCCSSSRPCCLTFKRGPKFCAS